MTWIKRPIRFWRLVLSTVLTVAAVSSIGAVARAQNFELLPSRDLETSSVNAIARRLVARLHSRETTQTDTAQASEALRTARVQIQFEEKNLASILHFGFLNQHQVAKSNGLLKPRLRAELEDNLIQMRIQKDYTSGATRANRLRPKYGYLTFEKNFDGEEQNSFVKEYGNLVAVLKSSVNDRVTFTTGDSLDNSSSDYATISKPLRAYTLAFAGREKLKRTALSRFGTDVSDPYWEAQVWGDVSTFDIDYFLVGCFPERDTSREAIKMLLSAHIPVFACRLSDDNSHLEKTVEITK